MRVFGGGLHFRDLCSCCLSADFSPKMCIFCMFFLRPPPPPGPSPLCPSPAVGAGGGGAVPHQPHAGPLCPATAGVGRPPGLAQWGRLGRGPVGGTRAAARRPGAFLAGGQESADACGGPAVCPPAAPLRRAVGPSPLMRRSCISVSAAPRVSRSGEPQSAKALLCVSRFVALVFDVYLDLSWPRFSPGFVIVIVGFIPPFVFVFLLVAVKVVSHQKSKALRRTRIVSRVHVAFPPFHSGGGHQVVCRSRLLLQRCRTGAGPRPPQAGGGGHLRRRGPYLAVVCPHAAEPMSPSVCPLPASPGSVSPRNS